MKRKVLMSVLYILAYVFTNAQPPAFFFNTAVSTTPFAGLIGLNQNDNSWRVSNTNINNGGINGPYVSAVRCAPVSGWVAGTTNSEWITYPKNCGAVQSSTSTYCPGTATATSNHACYNPTVMVNEEFYRIDFNLLNPCAFDLSLNMWGDNSVYQVFVNTQNINSPFWTGPNNAIPFMTYAQAQVHNGYAVVSTVNFCNAPWVVGNNYIIVRVVSNGGPGTCPDYTGLLVQGVPLNGMPGGGNVAGGNGGSNCCLGNLCSATSNPLTGDYAIPLGNNKFHFTGQGTIDNNTRRDIVTVGYNCGASLPLSRFSVVERQGAQTTSDTYAAHFKNDDKSSAVWTINAGIFAEAKMSQAIDVYKIGGIFEAFNKLQAYGVVGRTSKSMPSLVNLINGDGDKAIGGAFISDTSVGQISTRNLGVFAKAANSRLENFGTYSEALSSNVNIGVLGCGFMTAQSPKTYGPIANIGIYGNANMTDPNAWAGYFDGDIMVTGTPFSTAGGPFTASDVKFKKDIKQLTEASQKLRKLNGYTYKFKTDEYKDKCFSKEEQIGLIAQELKEVFPQLVSEKGGYNYVNYTGLIPVLLEGFKEQQNQIENQQQQIDELKSLVQSLAGNTSVQGGKISGIPVNLSDKNTVVLNQNVPNPFAESTVITYYIPNDFSKAQIIFTTNESKIIKTVDITVKGPGSLNVFANDLTHGIYNYSLIIDGKTVDTKKMIKE